MSEKKRCSDSRMKNWQTIYCKNPATVERDGKHYCAVHDPEKVKARHAERHARWKRKWHGEGLERDIKSAERAVIEAAKKWLAHDTEDVGSFFGVMAELQRATTSLVNAEEALRVFKEGEGG